MSLLSVDEAQARLLSQVKRMPVEWVGLAEAGGRVLAEDLVALRTQPPTDVSAMDGYAVRAAEMGPGVSFEVIGESAAGHPFAGKVGPGECVRIFTGAAIPSGADAVVMQEYAEVSEHGVSFTRTERSGTHIRAAGLDFAEGVTGLTSGTQLGMGQIGLAAAMNHARLPVSRRPRVALLATGDELVAPGQAADASKIVASNTYAVAELVKEAGGEAVDLGIAPDDLDVIRATLRAALDSGADIVVLTGGASVGDHDYTRPALLAEGVDIAFWKLAMRPGKPLMFGRHGDTHVLGLPGNPVSSMVCGLLFLTPLIRAMLGATDVLPCVETARLAEPLKANDIRREYLRAILTPAPDGLVATPVVMQDSSLLSMIAQANGLIIRPEYAPPAQPGDRVSVIRLAG
ncbi:molybdopterin molybdotransferase MoeA [Oryzibacter oryziterrae]|uniref:molybdopterin molybdotransferase MoeA n=1 Tax=Oryzibacter oryziterrae TaxID=2766474 RepID=UPI001F39026D|nr:gephyrin-like molybdotransferase Glp [Oryzibacter oryziterrae]